MQVTFFSIMISLIWVSIFAKTASILRKHMLFLRYFSIYPLLAILAICLLRLFFLFELPFTHVITSSQILPAIQHILHCPLLLIGNRLEFKLINFLITVWLLIAVKHFFVKLHSYYRFKRLLRFLPQAMDDRLYHILEKVQADSRSHRPAKIIIHKEVQSPAIIGCIHPIIILPQIEFSEDELFGILTHEWCHYCCGHIYIKYLGEMIQSLFWWNPCFKQLNFEIAHALEMHSDKKVSRLLNPEQQRTYLQSILKVIQKTHEDNYAISSFTCSLLEKNNQEFLCQRFEMILQGLYKRNKITTLLFTLPVLCALFFSSYLFVIQPYNLPDPHQLGFTTDIPEDAYLIELEHTYTLLDKNGNFIADIKYLDDDLKKLEIISKE